MNRNILHTITFCLLALCALAQRKDPKAYWEKERSYLKYEKGEKYKGPTDWYGSSPSDLKSYDEQLSTPIPGSSGIQYNPQQLQRDRQKRFRGFERGGGKGTLKYDPKVERPDPLEIPDLEAPDVDLPDADIDLDAPSISPAFWRFLLFLILFIAVITIVYLIVKNRKPANKKLSLQEIQDDWNPEIITKSELELRLEEAQLREDYRECVRIYYTFILKELIKKGWIKWHKEKTNHHYVGEMASRSESEHFRQCVSIYDLVWYGEYHIDEEDYGELRPVLDNYLNTLSTGGE